MKKNKNRGISLIEILVSISIIAILSVIVALNLSKFHNQQVIKNTTADVVSLLNKARNDTISSKNSNTYGIHFQSNIVTLFTGTSYNVSSSNEIINFDSTVTIPSIGGITLNGGGSDIVFQRITGDTVNNGTIIIQLSSDATQQKIITISSLGIISVN